MSWRGVCVVRCTDRLWGGVAACLGSGVCVVCCADRLCGGVAACLGVACVLYVVRNEAQYKFSDDGRRPKHAGAIFV
jgi:hypothetical protein